MRPVSSAGRRLLHDDAGPTDLARDPPVRNLVCAVLAKFGTADRAFASARTHEVTLL